MIHDVNLFGETWLASTLLLEKGVSLCEDRPWEGGRPKSEPQTATKEPERQIMAMYELSLIIGQYMEPVVYFGIRSL